MNGPTFPVSLPSAGVGLLQAIPAGSANGQPPAVTRPSGAQGLRIYLGAGDAVQYFLQADSQAAPAAPPAVSTPAISGPGIIDEFLPPNVSIYFLPTTGAPVCRWM